MVGVGFPVEYEGKAEKGKGMGGWGVSGNRPRNWQVNAHALVKIQAREKSAKINFFGSGDRPLGWGSFTRRGGGRKVRALPRKFVFRISDVPGILPGCARATGVPKKFVQKKSVRVSRSQKIAL